jgi:hypothetical protein
MIMVIHLYRLLSRASGLCLIGGGTWLALARSR